MVGLLFIITIYAFGQPIDPATTSTDEQGNVSSGQTIVVPVTNPDILTASSDAAVSAFTQVVTAANNAIQSIRDKGGMQKYGERLTLMLTGIVILWSILKNIALKQSFPQLVGDLVFPIVIAAFVISAAIGKLPGIIDSSISAISTLFGGSGTSPEMSIAKSLLGAAVSVWNAESSDSGILSLAGSPLVSLAMLLLRLIVIALIVIAAALGVAAVLVAKFQMALAVALAPLLIPWIVFKPTEFLFSGWLSFFLKAGFGLVGVFAVATLVSSGAAQMVSLISTTPRGVGGVMTYAAMAGMSVIFTYLMLKGSDIGEGLISGSATGIGQLSSVAKGSGVTAPMSMAKAGLTGAGSVINAGAAVAAGKAIGKGALSTGTEQMATRAFGRGTIARASFETARGGNGSGKLMTSATTAATSTASSPVRTSLGQRLRARGN